MNWKPHLPQIFRGVSLGMIAIEAALSSMAMIKARYRATDSFASLGMQAGNIAMNLLMAGIVRVHHASNPRYLDRNYAGVLMVWDRLFGTFVAERDEEPPRYGIVKNIETFSPICIAFHEWASMVRELFAARSMREALGTVFGPPGWRIDGRGLTSKNIRAAWGTRHAN